MFCFNCGTQMADDAAYCSRCGRPCEGNEIVSRAAGRLASRYAWIAGAFAILILVLILRVEFVTHVASASKADAITYGIVNCSRLPNQLLHPTLPDDPQRPLYDGPLTCLAEPNSVGDTLYLTVGHCYMANSPCQSAEFYIGTRHVATGTVFGHFVGGADGRIEQEGRIPASDQFHGENTGPRLTLEYYWSGTKLETVVVSEDSNVPASDWFADDLPISNGGPAAATNNSTDVASPSDQGHVVTLVDDNETCHNDEITAYALDPGELSDSAAISAYYDHVNRALSYCYQSGQMSAAPNIEASLDLLASTVTALDHDYGSDGWASANAASDAGAVTQEAARNGQIIQLLAPTGIGRGMGWDLVQCVRYLPPKDSIQIAVLALDIDSENIDSGQPAGSDYRRYVDGVRTRIHALLGSPYVAPTPRPSVQPPLPATAPRPGQSPFVQ